MFLSRNIKAVAFLAAFIGVVIAKTVENGVTEDRKLMSSSASAWTLKTVAGHYGTPYFVGTNADIPINPLSTSGSFYNPISIASVPGEPVMLVSEDTEGYEIYAITPDGLESLTARRMLAMSFSPTGDLFYIESEAHLVKYLRAADLTGSSTQFVGRWGQGSGYSGDGFAAVNAYMNDPQGLTVDSMGNVFIADSGNKVIRKVDTNSIITTFAGQYYSNSAASGPVARYSGDGGAANLAHLGFPTGVACDMMGNIYIADNAMSLIRKVDMEGIITTIAGVPGAIGYNGDGIATLAIIEAPFAIVADPMGNVYFSAAVDDNYIFDAFMVGAVSGYMIRRIDAKTGMLTTIAGQNTYGKDTGFDTDMPENYPDDPAVGVPGTSIALNSVPSLALDSMGNLWFAEPAANVVRVLVPTAPTSMPTMSKTHKPTMKMSQRPTMKKTAKPTMKKMTLTEETAQEA